MESDSGPNIRQYELIAKRARDRERRERTLNSDSVYRSDFQETRYASNDAERIIKTYSTGTAAHLVNFGEAVELRVIEESDTEDKERVPTAEIVKELRNSARSIRSNLIPDQKNRSRTREKASDEVAGKSRDSVRFNSQATEERTKSGSRSSRHYYGRQKSAPETVVDWKLKTRAGKSSDNKKKQS